MKHKDVRLGLLTLMTALLLILGPQTRGPAFTAGQATNAWNSYNNAFYVGNSGNAYYRFEQGGGLNTNGFWTNAEEIEMAVDRAQRSGSSGDMAIVTSLVNGFDSTYGTDWTNNIYNDDIMWACIAHLRAYFVTGKTQSNWAVEAANNFNWVYNGGHSPGRVAAQVDSTFGGGMWWTTDHSTATGTKNACVNGPAAIVGYYLSTIWPTGTGFLSQAKAVYNWETATLVNSSGNVADHIGPGSTGPTGIDLSYNAGTYIGASYLLGSSSQAALAATDFKNNFCGAYGILPNYGTGGGNNSGFNGIFLRWMALYMIGSGTQSTYSQWLYNNANVALSMANSSGLIWDNWTTQTSTSLQYSWDCLPAIVALNCLPPQTGIVNGLHTLSPGNATGSCLDDDSGGTGNGNHVQIWQAAGNTNQLWNFANISGSNWNIALITGAYCLDDLGGGAGVSVGIWSCNGGNNQLWTSSPAGTGYVFKNDGNGLCLDVNGANTANGTDVDSWTCTAQNNQIWSVN